MQSDDNMPPSLEQEAHRFGRGSMNSDSLPITASCTPASLAGSYEGKRTQDAMVLNLPQTLPNTPALRQNDPVAERA